MTDTATPEMKLPHWDLSSIYSGFAGSDYEQAKATIDTQLRELEEFFDNESIERKSGGETRSAAELAPILEAAVEKMGALSQLGTTTGGFVYLQYSVNTSDPEALRELSWVETRDTKIGNLALRFRGWIGALENQIQELIQAAPGLAKYEFYLRHNAAESQYQMSQELEELASELSVDGPRAFSRLQSSVTSQLEVPFEVDGKTESTPISKIRNFAFDPDPALRERAYHAEVAGWRSIATPVAASLNAIKGASITLSKRRGRPDPLDWAAAHNRIDRATLDALMGSIAEFFPVFRRYLRSKARRLGKSCLPWWDLFAPLGGNVEPYSWDRARSFICERFGEFSAELSDFASHAFDADWIDAEPRAGKAGGGYCMPIVGRDESRILVNFDGSLDQVFTLAHELGHAYHNHCQNGLEQLRRGSPSTLAETASIFCETLVCEATLASADEAGRLAILESQLLGATQVCLDISARFQFEREVFDRRGQSTLSADELCEVMLEALGNTYGDAVEADTYHPYMWLLKPHYYSPDSHFYNFPYAFGHLFGLGLYGVYQKEGESFIPRYKELLRSTGSAYAAPLAQEFGIDLRAADFWRQSLSLIEEQVARYEALDC